MAYIPLAITYIIVGANEHEYICTQLVLHQWFEWASAPEARRIGSQLDGSLQVP